MEQLKIWGSRNDVHVVSHGMNTDPASVAFDAVKYAKENDVVNHKGYYDLLLEKSLTGGH